MLALLYIPAALAEITGCFSFWAWIRLHKSPLWLLPGIASLLLFAWLLTFSPAENAGKAYAIYGGIYIIMSLLWSWKVEATPPDHWDLIGAVFCLVGAAIILWMPRSL
ncbi:YnfA family protein [Zymomonas sp.]|uniref:YnfA family protein n=1 Tax=Zymomonas sp. TaxID=2068624 RepID=UPI0025FBD084|nr:YnfA family protein [Zymomonas sp.]MCA1956329.1 YnfA family protein [Zymomonas sp.]